ncbi:small glutamine-rich tetratricopeptide repeat-containing protein beta-like [Anthonomus grandis grandis]|uniref:small glutamine-rich tetratricopeptide repeat-containing protein beta-like n=1 Tax=Anthonomus grandis grandis TaxID=2921223 RepID=UPI0021664F7F|nr:small glutamine-rich tetratricopeptide repeat-containing protein beta-like [Anthonomus grandis grandis]
MDSKKRILVNNVINFLRDELSGNSLSDEKKESLEVAIQCLETAFEVENGECIEKVDLLSLISEKQTVVVTEEQKAKAEEHKNKGNTLMKDGLYLEAIDEYTKAIEANPNNAIYYCNRAAAYTRLQKDQEAINDCNDAIKLDPTYGKAYGRQGIAYSNLNMLDRAVQAYQTALKYDPTNTIYETNLKVAQDRLIASGGGGEPQNRQVMDQFSQFINNPEVINMASRILSDQNFDSMLSGLLGNMPSGGAGEGGMPATVETMLQAGQALAQRAANQDPEFYSRLMRNVQSAPQGMQSGQGSGNSNNQTSEPSSEKKDDESA